MIPDRIKIFLDEIDACLFSSDMFHNEEALSDLSKILNRWSDQVDVISDDLAEQEKAAAADQGPVPGKYGGLSCPCCGFSVDHDGYGDSMDGPGVDPTAYWCNVCELEWDAGRLELEGF